MKNSETRASTPWGRADYEEDFGDGITGYDTPGHGGYHLTKEANSRIPTPLRRKGGWYEEDVEWSIVAMYFPTSRAFHYVTDVGDRGTVLEQATRTVKRYYPDEYTVVTGESVSPKESHIVARRVARAQHPEDFEVRAALGDWDKLTPKGKVRVIAHRVRDGLPLVFFVPAGEYSPDRYLHPGTDEVAPVEETISTLRKSGYCVEMLEVGTESISYRCGYPGGGKSEAAYATPEEAWKTVLAEAIEDGIFRREPDIEKAS